MTVTILHGDCLDLLRGMADNSVDAIVTDPPYGLEFMGTDWDSFKAAPTGGASFTQDGMGKGFRALPSYTGSPNPNCRNCGGSQRGNDRVGFTRCRCDAPDFPNVRRAQMLAFQAWCEQWTVEALRVLKPGGHMLAFGGTRTWHRLACAVEDAGFEIRDNISWVYASGFPKSLNLDGEWQGWGTALKPAHEPIVVARKPLAGTVASNVAAWGTGAINIDATRVSTPEDLRRPFGGPSDHIAQLKNLTPGELNTGSDLGRWPSNLILSHAATPDGADLCDGGCVDGCPVRELDQQSGSRSVNQPAVYRRDKSDAHSEPSSWEKNHQAGHVRTGYGDSGGASRFFPVFRYEPKAPSDERAKAGDVAHPTVKPLDLMRWLVRLVTPPDGTVLDPFAGSGTTGEAAVLEGSDCILIEREADYLPLIRARVRRAERRGHQPELFG